MSSIKLDGLTLASTANSKAVLDSGVVFPTGHVIQTVTDQHEGSGGMTVTTTAEDVLGSDLQCTITPSATGNKLFIQAFIEGVYNNATTGRGMHAGFAYDANFNSGNGTTIGPRAIISPYTTYINLNNQVLGNIYYSIVVTVGTQAPPAGSASIIRPILQAVAGDMKISANSNQGAGLFSMMVMEIQS